MTKKKSTGTDPVIHEPIAQLAVHVDEVHPYKKNARQGNVDAIADSLARNGQYRPIVVNKQTGEILAGNHTYAAARSLGWTHVAATFVDVDEDQAARIVLADNRTADLGSYDDGKLLELLQSVSDLEGTGYDLDDLDDLMAADEPAPGTADLLDAPDDDNYQEQYAVTVMCANEDEQIATYEKLNGEGYTCKVVTV